MFPYPSGHGLHIGHPEGYTASDIVSRYLRMNGYNVLHPMGWDAFGLPAENYAIETKTHPRLVVEKNVKRFKEQLQTFGFDYDWSREINTTDPEYYKWTQWIFLQMFKAGLAYEAEIPINWCPKCKTGLANEEVSEGKCERCHTFVARKEMRQWMLAITKYADRLLEDLEELDWPEKIKTMQRNWIGRSEGATVKFQVSSFKLEVPVYTTRPDTLFGATYVVLAPEHELVKKITTAEQKKEVGKYIRAAKKKSDLERAELTKEKSGVFTGSYAVNPVNGEKIPVWISDYVLVSYGTGAIMAVPAHDERDFAFAKKFKLPIVEVISPDGKTHLLKEAYVRDGILVNSSEFSGLYSEDAKERISEWLTKKGLAKKTVNYKLRDWVFSRQRYWGEPFPIVFCEECKNLERKAKSSKFSKGELLNPGWVAVPEEDLPVTLPDVERYEPTGTGESPLVSIKHWVETICPKCGGPARRETNTMPQWAGSCWYYLAYVLGNKNLKLSLDSARDPEPVKGKVKSLGNDNFKKLFGYWLPVDLYQGGAEHAVLHLLYARFWHKFLYDIGVVSTKEPFYTLRNQGLILGLDGQKMSKSRGNIINPDEVIKAYGADTVRMYEMFMGPLEDDKPWDAKGIVGIYRFLGRVWNLIERLKVKSEKLKVSREQKAESPESKKLRHKTIKKVTEDIEGHKFNTAISAMMEFTNELTGHTSQTTASSMRFVASDLLKLLAPFAPHITEELWQNHLRKKGSIHLESWPKYDPKLVQENTFELVIQVNGRVRATVTAPLGIEEEEAKKLALAHERTQLFVRQKDVKRVVYVPNRLLNIVI